MEVKREVRSNPLEPPLPTGLLVDHFQTVQFRGVHKMFWRSNGGSLKRPLPMGLHINHVHGKMDTLPEVLRVVISEALTSGKKLSWSVWDNGEITSVKLLWKPEVVDAPIQSEIPPHAPQPATSISHLGLRAHIKKKRSSSSWKRSKQRLKTFWKRKSARKGKSMPLLLLEEVRNLRQLRTPTVGTSSVSIQ